MHASTRGSKHPKVPQPCACTEVKKIARLLGRTYDAALAPSPMNVTQLAVLRCIERRKGEPLSRVAEELEMDRTSLYRALEPMTRDGWLKMTAGPDARARSAVLTAKGCKALAEAGTHWDGVQTDVVAAFGIEKWAQFMGELQRLAACAAEADGKRSAGH